MDQLPIPAECSQALVGIVNTPRDARIGPKDPNYNDATYWRCHSFWNQNQVLLLDAAVSGKVGDLQSQLSATTLAKQDAQDSMHLWRYTGLITGFLAVTLLVAWWVTAHKRRLNLVQMRALKDLTLASNLNDETDTVRIKARLEHEVEHNDELLNKLAVRNKWVPAWPEVMDVMNQTVLAVQTRLTPGKQLRLDKERMLMEVQRKAEEATIVLVENENQRAQERWKLVTQTAAGVNKSMLLVQEEIRKNPAIADLFPRFQHLQDALDKMADSVTIDRAAIHEIFANSLVRNFANETNVDLEASVSAKDDDVWKG